MGATSEATAADEALYQQALQELKSPKPARVASLVYIVLFLVFVGSQFSGLKSISSIALLLAVILFHEGGHALGMHLFGFRDVRMFFIPFFGAAVSGRSRGAAAWKEAVVSLLGPLPGIIAAFVVFKVMQRHPFPGAVHLVQLLIFLNAFNLLPFGFLDGGRFLDRVLFSRHRYLEVGFQAVGCLLLAVFALKSSILLLGLFAVLALVRLPRRLRILKAAALLRRQHPALIPDPDSLGDSEGRAVFAAAREILPMPAREQPTMLAVTMEGVLDGTKRAPGVLATLGLLGVYGLAMLAGLVGVVLVASETGSADWRTFEQTVWRVDFPQDPHHSVIQLGPDAGSETWRAAIEGVERFTIIASDGPDDERWMDVAAGNLAEDWGAKVAGWRPIDVGGHPGREYEFVTPGRVSRARLVAAGSRRYRVVSSAPKWGGNQQRFLDSFALGPAPKL